MCVPWAGARLTHIHSRTPCVASARPCAPAAPAAPAAAAAPPLPQPITACPTAAGAAAVAAAAGGGGGCACSSSARCSSVGCAPRAASSLPRIAACIAPAALSRLQGNSVCSWCVSHQARWRREAAGFEARRDHMLCSCSSHVRLRGTTVVLPEPAPHLQRLDARAAGATTHAVQRQRRGAWRGAPPAPLPQQQPRAGPGRGAEASGAAAAAAAAGRAAAVASASATAAGAQKPRALLSGGWARGAAPARHRQRRGC